MNDYLTMIDNKTGGFFRIALRLIVVEASAPPSHIDKLIHLITLFGRFYQIRDDYQNLTSDEVSSLIWASPLKSLLEYGLISPSTRPRKDSAMIYQKANYLSL